MKRNITDCWKTIAVDKINVVKPLSTVKVLMLKGKFAFYYRTIAMAVYSLLSGNLFQTSTSTLHIRMEIDRFEGWTCTFINPRILAKSVFLYTKKDDIAKCTYCSIEIGKCEPGDNIVNDHRRWSPNCIFLKGYKTCEDVCGQYELKPNSFSEGKIKGLQKLTIPSQNQRSQTLLYTITVLKLL